MTAIASKAQLRMSLLRYALVTVPLVVLLGTVSGRLAGMGEGNRWFEALARPAFASDAWLFGAAWLILYVLLGVALAMLLHAHGARRRGVAIALFVILLLASYAWAPVFFAMHRLGWALGLAGLMIVLAVALVVLLWGIRRFAAGLLLLYLAWLCVAALLTASIRSQNPAAELAPAPASTDITL